MEDPGGLWSAAAAAKLPQSCLTLFVSPWGLQPAWLLCPWDFPSKNIGVGCHFLLQGIFLTQGSNLGLLHGRGILYHLSQGISQRQYRGNCDNYAKNQVFREQRDGITHLCTLGSREVVLQDFDCILF